MTDSINIKTIILLVDGIDEHVTQSRGVAKWIAELTGAEILEAKIPELTGVIKIKAKRASRGLVSGSRRDARDWLATASGDTLVRKIGHWFSERNIHEGSREVLLISTGSDPAPYNLALGYIWRCACATIMTPEILGTNPFDFAIVPEYEFPERKSNIFVTLGAPNMLTKEKLTEKAVNLFEDYPPSTDKKWSVIIGGDDNNHVITSIWIKKNVGRLMRIAELDGASLYIAVKGNISKEANETFRILISRAPSVQGFFIVSKDSENPLPAMMSFSDELFCTENLLDIISESITVGNRVILMRMDWKRGIKNIVQKTIAIMVSKGAIKQELLLGTSKFEILFSHLIRHNYIVEFGDWMRRRHARLSSDEEDVIVLEEFNEAKRSAEWIVSNWNLLF